MGSDNYGGTISIEIPLYYVYTPVASDIYHVNLEND
jgi:hypothetical protein